MPVIIVENPREGVVLVRINRPDDRNAINQEVRDQLVAAYHEADADAAIRCLVLTGNEKAFAAGADLKQMAEATPDDVRAMNAEEFWRTMTVFPKPVIAAVNGYALGAGCELALTADIIIAGQGARFGLPEVRVGILPGGGGTQRLPRAVGRYRAMKMMLTGEFVSGAEALDMELASEITEDGVVLDRSLEIAEKIAALPPLAVRKIKEVVNAGLDMPLGEAMKLEREGFYFLLSTEDRTEGMRAFIEKRDPEFKGK